MKRKNKLAIREIVIMGMMIAILEAAKQALAAIPNVELVTLLLILYTLFLGGKVLYVILAYVLIEGCLYGFGIWWFSYLYVWPLLALFAWLFRRQESVWFWSIFSGAYGLFFGALCALVQLVIGGPAAAFTWWVAGIPYDLIHGVSNFILCLVLFRPLNEVLRRLRQQFPQRDYV